MRDILVFYSDFDNYSQWKQLLQRELPDLDVRRAEDIEDPSQVRYALVWKPPIRFFHRWPNLELVINLGAGVDALVSRDDLPDVAVTRLSDPNMARMMAGYVLFAVLRYAREIPFFERMQREAQWCYRHPRSPETLRIGVLGLGELGKRAAEELARQGFSVAGWSRSPKRLEGIECYHGLDSLSAFLADCEILVVMLPSTPDTRGLLDAERLAALPRGASLINVSRGDIIDETALIEQLQSGHLGAATLDVFAKEPLEASSPLWGMQQVLITPHLASVALPDSAAAQVAENIRRLRQGKPPHHRVDLQRGY